MLNLSTTYNRSEAGILFSTTTKMTLDGKILRVNDTNVTPTGTGIAAILGASQKMIEVFGATTGTFQIKCSNDLIFEACGVRVNSFDLNKTNDNWVFSADYRVELEYNRPAISGHLIKNGSDSWSLEPMEEYIYASLPKTIRQKPEYSNPNLRPKEPTIDNQVPILDNNGTSQGDPRDFSLNFINIPQFKLSRKISAEGIFGGTGLCHTTTPASNFPNSEIAKDYSAYLNAKNWVAARLAEPFGGVYGVGPSGAGPTFSSGAIHTIADLEGNNLFLYNHLRTTNFDSIVGRYEVNETWLAMPTGIRYVEDYSIESSTDERFLRTVRVQGTVKGLMIAQLPIMSGASGVIPNESGIIDIRYSMNNGTSGTTVLNIIDLSGLGDKTLSRDNNFYNTKYENALSGWINDIKPYLYRRASFPINLENSSESYADYLVDPNKPPNNPIYCLQRLLNIIPISTTEGHDPRKGTISYTYEFNDKFRFLSGVLSESLTINQTGPVDVINEAFVLGRRLGPVLQSLGAKTSAKKDVIFEVIVFPPSSVNGFFLTEPECPLFTGGTIYSGIKDIIEGLKPFGDRSTEMFGSILARENEEGQVYVSQDNYSWNPMEGRYSRTIGWIYQTCNLSKSYLDD
jgi:hypothetical protein